jgi:AraC family transcriptional regulator of adaptative response/methylated-DNA-[protein]-cysteine methyltransferase
MPSLMLERAWEAVLERDRRFDGQFVYGVASTKVYCRPSCPSRRPSRFQVTFFDSSRLAETAGFRACRRCRPESADEPETEKRIDQARRYLDEHYDEPVTLRQLAGQIGMSPYYLQRVFKRLVGSSPKEYRDARRVERFKTSLKRGETVTNATYEAGFGSSSRVYERANSDLGMTPSVFQAGGLGTTIGFTTKVTVVGQMLVAVTKRGIVTVRFGNSDASLVASLRRDYPKATLRRETNGLRRYVSGVLQCLAGQGDTRRLPLDLHASAFQRRVWKALQQIPYGKTRSYRDVARAIGRPAAVRAVARACATNPIAVAIPCHRVVREDGRLGGYRWGLQRKERLLALEQESIDRRRA